MTDEVTTSTIPKATPQEQPAASGDVAVRPANAVTTAADNDFSGFAGEGFQGLGKDDLAIPFLVILQSGSPQLKRSEGEYIPGAAEGMLYNSVTRQLLDPVTHRIRNRRATTRTATSSSPATSSTTHARST